jgi:Flp pilus assembly protein TadD
MAVKTAFLILALIGSTVGFAGTCVAQSHPPSELPMYGGIQKTPAMIAADKKFLDDIDAKGLTRAASSDAEVALGWKYFMERRDIATAMKRFNQAWLLDPGNGDAYHGMAIVVIQRDGDAPASEQLFKRALAAPRSGPNVRVDYGRFLLMQSRPRDAVPVLEQGVRKPGVAPDAQALLALAYRDVGDWPKSCGAAKAVRPVQPLLKTEVDKILQDARCR